MKRTKRRKLAQKLREKKIALYPIVGYINQPWPMYIYAAGHSSLIWMQDNLFKTN
jgi:hypothetical protein